MSMVVQHNMQAMNANRMLGVTTGQQAKSTEKLSSGYKINRAADDAAGLTISEKMRKQIRGLDQASTNAQDGVSAVQTAEGALTEVHSMLQRMNELAVQAANGTNSQGDRDAIQAEIDQLNTEIDRVAETTKFNEIYLLKGDGTSRKQTLAAHDAGLAGELGESVDGKTTFTADPLEVGGKVTIGGKEYTIVDSADPDDYQSIEAYLGNEADGDQLIKGDKTYTYDGTNSVWKDEEGNAMAAAFAPELGDTLIVDGEQKTLVGDATVAMDTSVNPSWADGDTITDAQGNVYTYYTKAVGDTDALAKAGFYASQPAVADKDTAEPDYEVKGGEEYTLADGTTKGVVSASDNGIDSVDAIQNAIKGLADGDTVKISSEDPTLAVTGKFKEYTVGVTTKEDGSVYTADDIAALIKGGQYVNDGTNTYYALPSSSDSKSEITLNEAYDMMAEELKAASDIGTDADSKSTVKNNGDGTFEITQGKVEVDNALDFNLHVGADADMTNKINVNIDTMNSANLGIKGLNVSDDSGKAATYAIDAIADAVAKVSEQRSDLGAVQNRLEHTIANLDNIVENTTSAESRIRDTDMAEEMVEYSKNNILAQAGQSMLAQANQSNQGVLSLLG